MPRKLLFFCKILPLVAVLLAVLLLPSHAHAQSINISSSATTGNPGDVITFNYGYDLGAEAKDRTEIKFDGADLSRSDVHGGASSGTGSNGTFTWTATPGTHVFRMYLRTKDGNGDKKYFQDLAVVQISGWETNEFSHPSLMLSEAEIDTIKERINAPASSAMKTAWNSFNARWNYPSEYGGWAIAAITPTNDVKQAHYKDSNHLVENAIAWALSGENKYADTVIGILNAWAGGTTQWWGANGGVYPFLTTTHYMDRWVIAAEIMRDYKGGYDGWLPSDRAKFESFARKVMVPAALAWWGNLGNPNGSPNQSLNVAKARIMLGIYLDDKALFQNGYDHMFATMHLSRNINPGLAGAQNQWPASSPINKAGTSLNLFELSIDNTGEVTEINRGGEANAPDLGHTSMCAEAIQLTADALCHQGYDMYDMRVGSETLPRILKAQNWLEQLSDTGVTMQLHLARGNVVAGANMPRDYEGVYNHYKHRSNSDYDIATLEAYVQQKRADGTKGIYVLTHADLSQGAGQVNCEQATTPPTCDPGKTLCNGTCVDTDASAGNCGACGNACDSGKECSAGICECSGTLNECGGSCVDTETDSANCGSCDATCGAGSECQAGGCACTGGATDCDAGSATSCKDTDNDASNCGACGVNCVAGQVCTTGSCECTGGKALCSDECVNTDTNLANCGACGTTCPDAQVCVGGSCENDCGSLTDCTVACANTDSDVDHCGACGASCAADEACVAGSCVCGNGFRDCDGKCVPDASSEQDCGGACVETAQDGMNCGACGSTCASGATCESGACECSAGLEACAETCVDTSTSGNNCGACGTTCLDGEVCSLGSCATSCAAGLSQCGQDCVDTNSDMFNCGACAVDCNLANSNTVCSTGQCTLTGCPSGFFDIDADPSNGCEYSCSFVGEEVCNGQDNDCNGLVDDGLDCGTTAEVTDTPTGTGGAAASDDRPVDAKGVPR